MIGVEKIGKIRRAYFEQYRSHQGDRADAVGIARGGSLLDYCLPRAADLPPFHSFTDRSTPATTNMFGAKGAGECGVVGTPPAIVAAVVDALGEYGVRHLDMPIRFRAGLRLISTGQGHSRIS